LTFKGLFVIIYTFVPIQFTRHGGVMSAKRSRQQDKLATRRTIATQLAESTTKDETSSDEEQERLIKETQLEDDRRETILSGFDPDSTPLQKFSFVEDFDSAVLTIGYLSDSEKTAV